MISRYNVLRRQDGRSTRTIDEKKERKMNCKSTTRIKKERGIVRERKETVDAENI